MASGLRALVFAVMLGGADGGRLELLQACLNLKRSVLSKSERPKTVSADCREARLHAVETREVERNRSLGSGHIRRVST